MKKSRKHVSDSKNRSRPGSMAAALVGHTIFVEGVGEIRVKNLQHLKELLKTQTK